MAVTLDSLRDFIAAIEAQGRGDLVRVERSVSVDKELTEIADRCMKAPGGGPALLFQHPTLLHGGASRYPVAVNLFGSERRMALALALWCVLTFALVGRGTPAPFDPPRRLVVRGPYRFVRNPMYIGAAIALAGAALFYRSLPLLGYLALFLLVTHLFVCVYEEPTLRRAFGAEYEAYCRRVRRWWPRGGRDAR